MSKLTAAVLLSAALLSCGGLRPHRTEDADPRHTKFHATVPVRLDPRAPEVGVDPEDAKPGPYRSRSGEASNPPYNYEVWRIDNTLAQKMRKSGSWKPACPVPLGDLRLLRIKHRTVGGTTVWGELIVHKDVVNDVTEIFEALFNWHFPIRKMRLIDVYGASDDASVADNNTSAFNCRPITGRSSGWSKHSYGRAIDINPLINPYWSRRKGQVIPPAGRKYLNRRQRVDGMIKAGGEVVEIFRAKGWKWGGSWRTVKDWQHFEKKR